jgi:predicted DNA-binding protein
MRATKMVFIGLKIPRRMKTKLKRMSFATGRPVAEHVRQALTEYFARDVMSEPGSQSNRAPLP